MSSIHKPEEAAENRPNITHGNMYKRVEVSLVAGRERSPTIAGMIVSNRSKL